MQVFNQALGILKKYLTDFGLKCQQLKSRLGKKCFPPFFRKKMRGALKLCGRAEFFEGFRTESAEGQVSLLSEGGVKSL